MDATVFGGVTLCYIQMIVRVNSGRRRRVIHPPLLKGVGPSSVDYGVSSFTFMYVDSFRLFWLYRLRFSYATTHCLLYLILKSTELDEQFKI